MSKLSLTVEPDDDGVWRIRAELKTDAFQGRGWCWGSPLDIEEFAAKLDTYPMAKGEVATFALGYDDLLGTIFAY